MAAADRGAPWRRRPSAGDCRAATVPRRAGSVAAGWVRSNYCCCGSCCCSSSSSCAHEHTHKHTHTHIQEVYDARFCTTVSGCGRSIPEPAATCIADLILRHLSVQLCTVFSASKVAAVLSSSKCRPGLRTQQALEQARFDGCSRAAFSPLPLLWTCVAVLVTRVHCRVATCW